MVFRLGSGAEAAGWRLAALDTIGSTNAEAMARGRAGDPGRLWVVAREQTAGRGRRGRPWSSARGNLAASLLTVLDPAVSTPAMLGFVAGVAITDALRNVAGGEISGLRLKWPNDVLIDGAKLAGILLEGVVLAPKRQAVVAGIGVNIGEAPTDTPYPATSLSQAGIAVCVEDLFAALSDAWIGYADLWQEGREFGAIRALWLDRAAGLGEPISVKLGDTVVRGIFETIDETGRLLLRGADGVLNAITAGDVHFGTAMTAEA